MIYVWIPEAPETGTPVYAINDETLRDRPGANMTLSASEARQFATEEECRVWCEANPSPAFEPREHGFDDGTATSETSER